MSAADRTAESAAKSVEGGGQDYLFKPLIKELLIKKVETLLEIVQGYGASPSFDRSFSPSSARATLSCASVLVYVYSNKRAAAYRAIVARKEQEILELKSKVSELDTFRQAGASSLPPALVTGNLPTSSYSTP